MGPAVLTCCRCPLGFAAPAAGSPRYAHMGSIRLQGKCWLVGLALRLTARTHMGTTARYLPPHMGPVWIASLSKPIGFGPVWVHCIPGGTSEEAEAGRLRRRPRWVGLGGWPARPNVSLDGRRYANPFRGLGSADNPFLRDAVSLGLSPFGEKLACTHMGQYFHTE